MTALTPIRRELVVPAPPIVAFEVFTDRIASWWPLADFSVYGAASSVAFSDGQIVESAAGQPDAVWGTVTRWDPPHRLSFSWHPGRSADRASQVTVTFTAQTDQTLVQLEHSGWEVFADPDVARSQYDEGWPVVLGQFSFTVSDHQTESTWVVLSHRPAVTAPAAPALFADPRFADHLTFLNSLRDKGYLVAAGPLPDDPGAGLAIVRFPGSDRLAEVAELATAQDRSVVDGLLSVVVRPWLVTMQAE